MTWTVMRRDVDRNVRVAECEGEAEARSELDEARRLYPNEDSWIEHDGPEPMKSEPAPIPRAVPHDTWSSAPSNRVPEARVVSPVVRSKPRRVPWYSTMYMLGPTVAAVAVVLGAGAAFCGFFCGGRRPMHVFSAATENALGTLMIEWIALAILVVAAAAIYERRFLRRACVIEGVMTRGEVLVGIEGKEYRLTSIAPSLPDGTRVPLFWHGRRLVELSKAGAEIDACGELSWDGKALPYRLDHAWPGAFLGLTAVVIVMLVTLALSFT